MAVNTVIDGDFLVIDDGTKKKYFDKLWWSLDFTSSSVIITDFGVGGTGGLSVDIPFTEFQYDSVAYNTEALIFGVLKDKKSA